MTTKDHNNNLVQIHFLVSGVSIFILATSPWTFAPSLLRPDQIRLLVTICGVITLIAALMCSTAIAMRLQTPLGRKLALLAAPILMLIFWPFGVYSWWFLHSDGAKQMYGVKDD